MKKHWKQSNNIYLWMACVSLIAYCLIYGTCILVPTYTDWLMKGTDLTQHYLGWRAYRLSHWTFPIGMIDNLSYPYHVSVIFTDSIPILAVPFKLLSPLLPTEFQYFGLWGGLCFLLQGVLAVRLLKNFTDSDVVLFLSGCMFLLVPVVLQRMYYHSALAGQWILFLFLEILFCPRKYTEHKVVYQLIVLTGILSGGIHIYFVLMNGIILLGICIQTIFKEKGIKTATTYLLIYIVSATFMVGLLGGLSSSLDATKWGLGEYALNLNGFINATGNVDGAAKIGKKLPVLSMWTDEGYAYLGAGCIILCFVAFMLLLMRSDVLHLANKHGVFLFSVFIVILISLLIAISPRVGLGNHQLYQLMLPEPIYKAWSVFRATGRISWVIIYILMFGSIIVSYQVKNARMIGVMLSICLMVQVYDLSDIITKKHMIYSQKQMYESPLKADVWEMIGQNDEIKHVIFVSDVNLFEKYHFASWALDHGMTINDFYFARNNEHMVEEAKKVALQELRNDTIFIFLEADTDMCIQYDLTYDKVDTYIIGRHTTD